MKKFIQDTLVLTIVFLILNWLCYKYITYPTLYKDYENLFTDLTVQAHCNTFILSDSHGWRLTTEKPKVNKLFKEHNIYNFSYGSDSYGDILIKLKWLITNQIQVDTILVSVDDHMLSKKSANSNRNISFSKALWHQEAYGISLPKYVFYHIVRYLPVVYPSNQKLIENALKSKTLKTTSTSVDTVVKWQSLSPGYRSEQINTRLKSFFPKNCFKPRKKLEENLQQIIKIAKKNKINVIGIKFPLDSLMTREIDHIGAMDCVKERASELGIDLFLDYQNKYADTKYLSNQDHVNYLGAKMIANNIIMDLKTR